MAPKCAGSTIIHKGTIEVQHRADPKTLKRRTTVRKKNPPRTYHEHHLADAQHQLALSKKNKKPKAVIAYWEGVVHAEKDAVREHDRLGNPKRKSDPNMTWYRVTLRGKHIDTVQYISFMTAAEVKNSLINHDGYNSGIKVTKEETIRKNAGLRLVDKTASSVGIRHWQYRGSTPKGSPSSNPKKNTVKLGKHQQKMYSFLQKHTGWQGFTNKGLTKQVAQSLKKKGLIEINKFNQMRLRK